MFFKCLWGSVQRICISDSKPNESWDGRGIRLSGMNREKKKRQVARVDNSDDDVSIFDSEQQSPPKKETVKTIERSGRSVRGRRGQRSRESKLNLQEERIMSTLMKAERQEESEMVSETEEKEKPTDSPTKLSPEQQFQSENHCAVRNNLDDEPAELAQDELHWSDLQEIIEQHQVVEQPRVKRQYTRHVQPHSRSNKYHLMPAMLNHVPMAVQEQPLELKFEDFQMMNHSGENEEYGGLVGLGEIEQLQRELTSEMPLYNDGLSNTETNGVVGKDDAELRRSQIFKSIDRLRGELIKIEEESSKTQVVYTPPADDRSEETLFNDWKYVSSCNASKGQAMQEQKGEEGWRLSKSKTEGRIAMLRQIIRGNPFLTQVEMVEVLKLRDPVMNQRIERSVVLRLLKVGGFKKKKIRAVHPDCNNPRSLSVRREYALLLRQWQNSHARVVYYDEMVVSEYFDKESGWCNGQEEIEERADRFIARSFVVMMLVGEGRAWWNVSFGESQREEYCHTFSKLVKAAEDCSAPRVIVVNPLSYRKPADIREIVERRGWNLLVLPVHGLHLNPCLAYFAAIRDSLKKRRHQSLQTLFSAIVQTLHEGDRSGWGQRSLLRAASYIGKALNREPF